MRRPSHLAMAKLATRIRRLWTAWERALFAFWLSTSILSPGCAAKKWRDTIVMFGSARIHSREQAQHELKEVRARSRGRRSAQWAERIRHAKSHLEMSRYYEEARELSRRITSWSLTARRAPEALRHLLGRRPRNHGRSEPRCFRRRRLIYRAQHPASARAAPQSLHHRRPEFLLPLFLHAQAVVRADGEGADRVSRRVRHDGRAI